MSSREWWQDFFELPDCLRLGAFPDEWETRWEVECLLRLLKPGPSDLILDACCGHGRHTLPLAAAGLRVVGLDRSRRLTRRAERTRHRRGLPGLIVRGDVRQIPFREAFTLVLNLFNSFAYLDDPADDGRVLAEMARCLRPGGRLLLETRNKDFQLACVPFHQVTRLADGGQALVECDFDAASRRLCSRWTRLTAPKEPYAESAIRLYSPDEFVDLFRAAGLRVLDLYGDYDGQPFLDTHRKLLILAEKPR